MSRIVTDLSTPGRTALGHAFEATIGKKAILHCDESTETI